ncbi:MAG: radical SAM family heme chaperone HemW [Muribaculaceae bacterium]|nr:radical SAM family heme chaperone HemW [Muribaculaceae bacterium]
MAGLYIHIPFCKKRCIYCDFYSTNRLDLTDRYVTAVVEEASLRHHELGAADTIRTIYLGGGTPSQLTPGQLGTITDGVGRWLNLSEVVEFTVEVNPDDVTGDYVKSLVGLGVNRISMGVQSFNDTELATINRRHDAKCAITAYDTIREAGIQNVSIDLIYGLPGQDPVSLSASVEQALKLRPEHISAYNLTYEEGTVLWKKRLSGEVTEADEDLCVEMYRLIVRRLKEAGYEHYEISNYALPGYRSRHNSSYWNHTPYIGLGAAAHSFDGSVRRSNPADLMAYINAVEQGRLPFAEEIITTEERYDEDVMVALRTTDGLDIEKIGEKYGDKVKASLQAKACKYLESGIMQKNHGRIFLTDEGMLLSDAVIQDLMWD